MPPAEMPASNYAVRLRAPFDTLRQTISLWALKAERIVVYEHPEDNNIHCHLLVYGLRETSDNLKKIMWKAGIALKGAGQLSFKTTFEDKHTKTILTISDETIPKYISYMSKGKYEPKYHTGYDQAFLEDCKSKWINHKRLSKDEQLYNDFIAVVQETQKKLCVVYNKTEEIKCLAIAHAKRKYGVINLGCRRDISMLLTTYAYDHFGEYKVNLPFE